MGGARREAVCFTAPATCTLPEVAAVSPPLVTLTKMSSHYNTQFIIPSTNGALFHGIYQFAAPPLVQRAQLRRVSCCYLCTLLTVFRRFRRFGRPSCAKRGNKRLLYRGALFCIVLHRCTRFFRDVYGAARAFSVSSCGAEPPDVQGGFPRSVLQKAGAFPRRRCGLQDHRAISGTAACGRGA